MISPNLHRRVHPDTPAITELLQTRQYFFGMVAVAQDDDGGAGPPLAIVPAT